MDSMENVHERIHKQYEREGPNYSGIFRATWMSCVQVHILIPLTLGNLTVDQVIRTPEDSSVDLTNIFFGLSNPVGSWTIVEQLFFAATFALKLSIL